MRTLPVLLLLLLPLVCIADDAPTTGDADYALAASDSGGLPSDIDDLAGTVLPFGGVIVFGGQEDAGPSTRVTRINPDTGEATPAAALPEARAGIAAGTWEGKVYAIGGLKGKDALKRVDVYDPATDKWSPGEPLQKPLYGAACVSTLMGMYLVGGNNGKRPVDEVYRFEPDKNGKWEWNKLGKLKTARWGHAAVALTDGRLLIVGGTGADGALASCEYFDGKKAAEAPSLPEPCDDFVAGVIYYPGAEVVVLRGMDGVNVRAPLRLSSNLNKWEPRPAWDTLARSGAVGIPWGGRLIAAGGRDKDGNRLNSVRSFGWSGQWKETLTPKDTADFKDLRFSPDGKRIVMGGSTRRIEVRDADTLELIVSRDQEEVVRTVDWSPDGKSIVMSGGTDALRIHDADTLAVKQEIKTNIPAGYYVRWSPKGDVVALGSNERHEIRIYDVADGRLARELKAAKSVCTDLEFTADGKRLLVVSKDGAARLWDMESWTVSATFEAEGVQWDGDITPDGRLVALGSEDGTISVFEVATGRLLMHSRHINGGCHTVTLRGDGMFVVGAQRGATGNEPEYVIWSVQTGQVVHILDAKGMPHGQFAEFHPRRNALYLEAGYQMSVMEFVKSGGDSD